MSDNKRSLCCHSPVDVEGKTTMYYVCQECKKACDVYTVRDDNEPLQVREARKWRENQPIMCKFPDMDRDSLD